MSAEISLYPLGGMGVLLVVLLVLIGRMWRNSEELKQRAKSLEQEITETTRAQLELENGVVERQFISQANIQGGHAPDGSPVMQMSGSNVVNPGDTFFLAVNPTTFQTRRIQVSTTYQGDTVTVTATFATLPSGLTYPQYVDVEVPDKQLSLLVQNYDYSPNG